MAAAAAALPAADEPMHMRFRDWQGQAMKPKKRTSGRGRARVAFFRCQRTQPEVRPEGRRGGASTGAVYKKYFGGGLLKKRAVFLPPAATPWWACEECGKDNLKLVMTYTDGVCSFDKKATRDLTGAADRAEYFAKFGRHKFKSLSGTMRDLPPLSSSAHSRRHDNMISPLRKN